MALLIQSCQGKISACVITDNHITFEGSYWGRGGLAYCDGISIIVPSLISFLFMVSAVGLVGCDGQISNCVIAFNHVESGEYREAGEAGFLGCDGSISIRHR